MPTIHEQRARQKKMIIVLVVLALAFVFIVFFGFGLGETPTSAPAGNVVDSGDAADDRRIVTVSLDISVFQHPVFTTLRTFGNFPIVVEDAGRANPFVPTQAE